MMQQETKNGTDAPSAPEPSKETAKPAPAAKPPAAEKETTAKTLADKAEAKAKAATVKRLAAETMAKVKPAKAKPKPAKKKAAKAAPAKVKPKTAPAKAAPAKAARVPAKVPEGLLGQVVGSRASSKKAKLLSYLIEHKKERIPRETLIKHVYGTTKPETIGNFNTCVGGLIATLTAKKLPWVVVRERSEKHGVVIGLDPKK